MTGSQQTREQFTIDEANSSDENSKSSDSSEERKPTPAF